MTTFREAESRHSEEIERELPPPLQTRRRTTIFDQKPNEPYNPFLHRNVRKPTSTFGALVHLLKTSLGSGILAMPMAFKNAGLVPGVLATVSVGLICTHCVYMLINSSQKLCIRHRVPTMTYSQTAEMSFLNGPKSARKSAKFMGILTTAQLLLSFILGNSVYVVIMSYALDQFVRFVWNYEIDTRYYSLMLWLPLICVCLVRTLKALVPLSIIANICVLVSFSIVLYYIFREINEPETVYLFAPPQRFPVFMATVIFAIEGIGTVMNIENEMKHPEEFLDGRYGILFIALSFVIVLYTVIGFFGYLQYGEETYGSITLNLPIADILAEASKMSIAVSIFFTYPLQFYVPINLVFAALDDRIQPKNPIWLDLLVRAGLVTLTILIAVVVPDLEPIIGLVGAVCFSVLGLLFPALIDTMTRHPEFGWRKWRLIKNIFISLVSVVTVAGGTIQSVSYIIDTYT